MPSLCVSILIHYEFSILHDQNLWVKFSQIPVQDLPFRPVSFKIIYTYKYPNEGSVPIYNKELSISQQVLASYFHLWIFTI